MFHWICPECGQEIAPGVKECPVCEPQASASSLPPSADPITASPAPEVASAVPVAAPVAAPLAPPVNQSEPEAVLQPEIPWRPVLQPKAFPGAKPPVVLDAIPAETRPVAMPQAPGPLVESLPHPETFADRLDALAEFLHGERIPDTAPTIFQESVGSKPVIVDVTFHADATSDGKPSQALLAAPRSSLLLLAEPQPPSVAGDIPIAAFGPRPAGDSVRSAQSREAEPYAASPVRLPEPPNRTAAPALAAPQDYSQAAERLIRPADCVTPTATAKALPKITLPGPALPRELMSLQAAGLVPIRVGGRRGAGSQSGWVMKYIVVGILLTAGVATYSMMPGSSTSAPPRPTPEPAPEPPVSARTIRPANSLARLVEVTGVRFMEVNKKPQIHYLVVNHSSAPLASMTVYVTLHATTAKAGQPPIAKITFRSPALAAYEAKEMFSSIERASAPVDLPDWQDLRADVDVQ